MSLTLSYAGYIKKVEFRQAGEKSIAEVSVCEKKYNKDKNADPEFDWVRATCWEPNEHLLAKLKKGNAVVFQGRFATRKYKDAQGVEKISLEVRVSDIQVFEMAGTEQQEKAVPAPGPRRPAAPSGGDDGSDGPPFMRRSEWE
jgi:single-stranded DNA-binding protein